MSLSQFIKLVIYLTYLGKRIKEQCSYKLAINTTIILKLTVNSLVFKRTT